MSAVKDAGSDAPVLLTVQDGIARIVLNRPESSNGMNIELLRALNDAIMTCHADTGVRCVLLSGNGPNFCAGGDVRVFAGMGENLPTYIREATAYLQTAISGLMRLAPPVVAAVHGFAAGGGGFGLVCAADFVVAAESAKFLAGATRVGMAPDAGVSVTLPRLVGMRKAMDILLTNPTLTATEAEALGIINRVVPDSQLAGSAQTLARSLADGAPRALAATKRLLWSGVGLGVEACLPEEARTVAELSGTADSREGLAAVIERRKPVFRGQ